MLHHPVRIVALALVIMFLAGCAARPGDPPTIDRIKPLLRLAVSLGTDRVLAENPTAVPLVLQITHTLMALFDGEATVTPGDIREVIRARMAKANLSPEMQMILETLIESIKVELRLVIERYNLTDSDVALLVREMVGWIQEVALRHMAALPPSARKMGK